MAWAKMRLKVAAVALASRLAVLAFAFVTGIAVRDYDTSAAIADAPCMPTRPGGVAPTAPTPVADPWPLRAAVSSALERTLVWDAVFFARAARCGYEHAQAFAFFPLLPAALAVAGPPLAGVTGVTPRAGVALAGLLLSNVAFVLSAVLMHHVTRQALGPSRPDLAARATVMYCAGAAAPFQAAAYTESVYAALTLAGVACLTGSKPASHTPLARRTWANDVAWWVMGVGALALSAAVRSNGLLTAATVIALPAVQAALVSLTPLVMRVTKPVAGSVQSGMAGAGAAVMRAAVSLMLGVVGCAAVAAPTYLHERRAYGALCSVAAGGVGGRPLPVWCFDRFPSVYRHVQSTYWGVGFLRYYQLKQLPNFLLAAPALALAATGVWAYYNRDPVRFCSLGLMSRAGGVKGLPPVAVVRAARVTTRSRGVGAGVDSRAAVAGAATSPVPSPPVSPRAAKRRRAPATVMTAVATDGSLGGGGPVAVWGSVTAVAPAQQHQPLWFLDSPGALPHVYQWLVMALVALLVMHVQVATRFLAACPPLYWWLARLTDTAPGGAAAPGAPVGSRRLAWAVWAWAMGYAAVGTTLFWNFYPWT